MRSSLAAHAREIWLSPGSVRANDEINANAALVEDDKLQVGDNIRSVVWYCCGFFPVSDVEYTSLHAKMRCSEMGIMLSRAEEKKWARGRELRIKGPSSPNWGTTRKVTKTALL